MLRSELGNGLIINGRFLHRRISGVERYAREVSQRLPSSVRFARPPQQLKGWKGHLWEQIVLPGLVGNEVLWSPANTGPLFTDRQVVTIHDAFPLDHPEWYREEFARWYQLLLPRLARQAKVVVTVSEYARARISSLLGLPAGSIVVAPGGVDRARFSPLSEAQKNQFRASWGLPATYLLFLSPVDPRKNLKGMLAAWEQVREQFPEAVLVIAGFSGQSQAFGKQVRTIGYVDESCLASLYSAATVFAIPSLDEGFGLPALEALACGVPLLAARAGALPEVAGEAALFVDPTRPEDIARGIETLLGDPALRQELVLKGYAQVRKYTWERTAAILQQVFTELALRK